MTEQSPPERENAAAAATRAEDAAPATAAAAGPQTRPPSSPTPAWLVPLVVFSAAILLFAAIFRNWQGLDSIGSDTTDDAYVRADVVPLSTKATGIVKTVSVNDFDEVVPGQLLVELKNTEYGARVLQAKAGVLETSSKINDMKERKEQQEAVIRQSEVALTNSRTSSKQASDNIISAQASVEEARAGIETAQASLLQSAAAIRAAEAECKRTSDERTRQESLLSVDSTTKQHVEQVVSEDEKAQANLQVQLANKAKALSELSLKRAQLTKALQMLNVAKDESEKSKQGINSRQLELTVQQKQRQLLDGDTSVLTADLSAKRAAQTVAEVDYGYTLIRAPGRGTIGEVKVKPGQFVNAGTQVVTLVSAKPWVIANFRETQLRRIQQGSLVEIRLDARPDLRLKGHVERIAPASGAQFSLLPPENSSGKFTKVTQRIPVKICFDEPESNLKQVSPGMSAIVTIKGGNKAVSDSPTSTSAVGQAL